MAGVLMSVNEETLLHNRSYTNTDSDLQSLVYYAQPTNVRIFLPASVNAANSAFSRNLCLETFDNSMQKESPAIQTTENIVN